MKKKIIIELNGVIFEPFDQHFRQIAVREYGRLTGNIVNLAYKYGIGRRLLANKVENVFFQCASKPRPRKEALVALDKISQLPDVSVEFCTQIPGKQHSVRLEQAYRAIAPCMDNGDYNLVGSAKSKRGYITRTTANNKDTMNYVLDSDVRHLNWPARWRIIPIFVGANRRDQAIAARTSTARQFDNMAMVFDFLEHRR